MDNGILRKPANYFEDIPPSQISHIPEVDLAYISNNKNNNNKDIPVTNYIFNIINLSYADFKVCFFDSILQNFNISPANFEVKALSLHQNYIDTTKKYQSFNLNNSILYAWAEKNQSTIGAIPIQQKIILNKNALMTRSIGSFRDVQNALSWNEAIQTLIESGEIIPMKKDKLSCAIIDFKIYVQYNYNPLEVSVNIQYTYRVHVPGYINKCEPNPCYSDDTSCPRKVFNFVNYSQCNHSDESNQSYESIHSETGDNQPCYDESIHSETGEIQPCYDPLTSRNTEEEEISIEGQSMYSRDQNEFNVDVDDDTFAAPSLVNKILDNDESCAGLSNKQW
jgi:hypothetical protein